MNMSLGKRHEGPRQVCTTSRQPLYDRVAPTSTKIIGKRGRASTMYLAMYPKRVQVRPICPVKFSSVASGLHCRQRHFQTSGPHHAHHRLEAKKTPPSINTCHQNQNPTVSEETACLKLAPEPVYPRLTLDPAHGAGRENELPGSAITQPPPPLFGSSPTSWPAMTRLPSLSFVTAHPMERPEYRSDIS